MPMKTNLSVLFFLFVGFPLLYAQNRITRHYGVEDGLTSNSIYSAIQDSKGFIWLATDNGVSRFDGKEFKNFTSDDGLPDNDIIEICEDALGRIWLTCYNAHPCYIYGNKVYTAANDVALSRITVKEYLRFCKLGKRMIITSYGLPGYEIGSSGELRSLPLPVTVDKLYGFGRNMMPANYLLKGCYPLYDDHFRLVDSFVFEKYNTVPVVNHFTWGINCFAVIYKDGMCYRYRVQHNRIIPIDSLHLSVPISYMHTAGEKLWANHYGYGVIPVDKHFHASGEILFPNRLIQYFMVDREGNYWGCTRGEGLYMIPTGGMRYYDHTDGLYQDNVLKLASWKDELYMGFNNSMIQVLKKGKVGNCPISYPASIQGKITGLCADSTYIVGGRMTELLVMNKHTGQVKNTGLRNIKCIYHPPDGNIIFFGTHAGCYRLSLPGTLIDTLFRGRTTAVFQRRNGDVMIGTLHGLMLCKKSAQGWVRDTFDQPDAKHTSISCIAETGNTLVVGTVQNGLLLIRGNDREFIRPADGKGQINCKSIFIDRDEQIWVATYSGIYKITIGKNIHDYRVAHMDKTNGLPANDISDIQVIDDTVYAASSKGLVVFLQNKKKGKNEEVNLLIHDVLVNKVSYFDPLNNNIDLPADSNTIEVHFSSLHFTNPDNIRFRYRLVGINNMWQYTDRNFVVLESLPHGSYTFEIAAKSADGNWPDQPVVLTMTVQPAWWQSTWFNILIALLTLFTISLVIHKYLTAKHEKQLKEASLKKRIAEIELKAVKAQINPHFIFNTLNVIQYFISNKKNELAETYLARLGNLLRRTLDFSNRTAIQLDEEITYLENYLQLEKLRFDDTFSFSIEKQELQVIGSQEIPPMVLQPHIENALRHGLRPKHRDAKKLQIRFSIQNNWLVCEVEDNGIGRKLSSEKNHEIRDPDHLSQGITLSETKLKIYEELTGKKVISEIIDKFTDRYTPSGTLVRIMISLS
jgi:hypothetical protein